jgi:hypothetical protein
MGVLRSVTASLSSAFAASAGWGSGASGNETLVASEAGGGVGPATACPLAERGNPDIRVNENAASALNRLKHDNPKESSNLPWDIGDPTIHIRFTNDCTGCEKTIVLKGHGFSRAVNATKQWLALASEGRISPILPENRSFSATSVFSGPARRWLI